MYGRTSWPITRANKTKTAGPLLEDQKSRSRTRDVCVYLVVSKRVSRKIRIRYVSNLKRNDIGNIGNKTIEQIVIYIYIYTLLEKEIFIFVFRFLVTANNIRFA